MANYKGRDNILLETMKDSNVIQLVGYIPQIMPFIKEFYAIQALLLVMNGYLDSWNKRHMKWKNEAEAHFHKVTEYLYQVFYDYFPLAIAREMRYAHSHAYGIPGWVYDMGDIFLGDEELFAYLRHFNVDSIYRCAKTTYNPAINEWDGESFGGWNWYQITKLCHKQIIDKVPHEVFVDLCVDLEHNTGSALNKDYGIFRYYEDDEFLDKKRYADPTMLAFDGQSFEYWKLAERAMRFLIEYGEKGGYFKADGSWVNINLTHLEYELLYMCNSYILRDTLERTMSYSNFIDAGKRYPWYFPSSVDAHKILKFNVSMTTIMESYIPIQWGKLELDGKLYDNIALSCQNDDDDDAIDW